MTTLNVPARRQQNSETQSEPRQDTPSPNSLPPADLSPNGAPMDAGASQSPLAARQQKRLSPAGASKTPTTTKKRAIYYPTGDGKPMAEDVLHRKLMSYCCEALEYHFASRNDVHVAGNDFVYYEEGNPKARISPDCYVCIGVESKPIRHFYKVWEENNIAPSVVIELTSKKTKKEDVSVKRPLYEQVLRVQEYFQFDPTGDYLRPRLQGQRLVGGVYQPIALDNDRMASAQLGLELVIEGETLRLYDPIAGEFLRTYQQAEAQRLEQQQRAQEETQRAETADRRAEEEARRTLAADRRAAEEARRAETEKQRAEAAEAELNRLRRELEAFRQQNSNQMVEDRTE